MGIVEACKLRWLGIDAWRERGTRGESGPDFMRINRERDALSARPRSVGHFRSKTSPKAEYSICTAGNRSVQPPFTPFPPHTYGPISPNDRRVSRVRPPQCPCPAHVVCRERPVGPSGRRAANTRVSGGGLMFHRADTAAMSRRFFGATSTSSMPGVRQLARSNTSCRCWSERQAAISMGLCGAHDSCQRTRKNSG